MPTNYSFLRWCCVLLVQLIATSMITDRCKTDATKYMQLLNVKILNTLYIVCVQLQQCARISDTGIDIVTQRCQRLIYLDVSNCDRLTDTSLLHIQDNCRRLRHLDLSYCSSLTIQAVDQLEARMQTLTSLRRLNVGLSKLPLGMNMISGPGGLKKVGSGKIPLLTLV